MPTLKESWCPNIDIRDHILIRDIFIVGINGRSLGFGNVASEKILGFLLLDVPAVFQV